MKTPLILLVCSFFLSSCLEGIFLSPEEGCNFSQYKGQRVAWNNLPINLFMDDGTNELQRKAVTEAVDAIHKQHNKIFFNIVMGVTPSLKWQKAWGNSATIEQDGKSGIYWISTTWPKQFHSKQAITRTRWRGASIIEADVIINASAYDFFLKVAKPSGVDLKSLYIHELLHVVGLKHIKEDPESVMNPVLPYGAQPQRRQLSSIDKASLDCEYK
ncbi:MAG: matrixin family metalloprotease [Bdellovibrionaceae bacterium]|nr:matrixin family metalloprotease [Pseudobdellovibrionaceae bacterium]